MMQLLMELSRADVRTPHYRQATNITNILVLVMARCLDILFADSCCGTLLLPSREAEEEEAGILKEPIFSSRKILIS